MTFRSMLIKKAGASISSGLKAIHGLLILRNVMEDFALHACCSHLAVIKANLRPVPLRNFKKATTLLDKHGKTSAHQNAMVKFGEFQRVVAGGQADVADVITDVYLLQAKENEEKLKSILDCILFCGKQNVSLRGHRNEKVHVQQGSDAESVTLFDKEAGNPDNFIALLEFRAQAGDKCVLRDFHLHAGGTGGKRVNYCSPTIQNELIECCAEHIRQQILQRARAAPFFSVMADEATDSGNLEQMPLVLRFVEDFKVHEEFMGFVECDTGVTGQALADKITSTLRDWHLDLGKWRGQGYDGAANMAGRLNGCAALIQQEHPKAVYCHCNVHALNLCVMAISKIALVSNMWSTLRQVSVFFEFSPKRQQKLETTIREMPAEDVNKSRKLKLVSLCKTRWVQRHTALVTFADLHPAVVSTLSQIEGQQSALER